LDAYLVDFGFNGSKFQNLKINYDVTRPNIDIHSPCRITLKNKTVLTADTICLDGRRGVIDNNGYTANANQVTVLSELGPAGFGMGSVINADELTIKALKTARIGFNSVIEVEGPVRLISTGDLPSSNAIIKQGSTVKADSLGLEASRGAIIGIKVEVEVSGDMSVISTGSAPRSNSIIKRRAVVTADSLNMTSGNRATLGRHTRITTTGNFHMEAASEGKCLIARSAIINAGSTSGNCLTGQELSEEGEVEKRDKLNRRDKMEEEHKRDRKRTR
jgi:hypothetical protein